MPSQKSAKILNELQNEYSGRISVVSAEDLSFHGTKDSHAPIIILSSLLIYALLFMLPVNIKKEFDAEVQSASKIVTGTIVCAWPKSKVREAERVYPKNKIRIKSVSSSEHCGDEGIKIKYIGENALLSVGEKNRRAAERRERAFQRFAANKNCPDPDAATTEDERFRADICWMGLREDYMRTQDYRRSTYSSPIRFILPQTFEVRGTLFGWVQDQIGVGSRSAQILWIPFLPIIVFLIDRSLRRSAKRQKQLAEDVDEFGLFLREFEEELRPAKRRFWSLAGIFGGGGAIEMLYPHQTSFEAQVPSIVKHIPWYAISNTRSSGFSGYSLRISADDDVWFDVVKHMAQKAAIVTSVVHELTPGMRREIEWLLTTDMAQEKPLVFIFSGKYKKRKFALEAVLEMVDDCEDKQVIQQRLQTKRRAPVFLVLKGSKIFTDIWITRFSRPEHVLKFAHKKNGDAREMLAGI